MQVVERLCKAHRIRYSRNFFPERTAELRRRLFGQQDEEESSADGEPGETVVEEVALETKREDEKREVNLVEQAPIEVPGMQERAACGGKPGESPSPVDGERQTVHRSVWILCESAPFSDDVGEYQRRRRRALVESLVDFRAGKRLYSRRVVSIWAYQRRQLRRAV